MKKSKFSEEQIAFALRQAESGTTPEEICRKMGISQATFYKWKKKFAGIGGERGASPQTIGRGEPEAEAVGGRPEPGQGDAAGGGQKKALKPARQRELAKELQETWSVSERRACRVIQMSRRTKRHVSVKDPQEPLRMKLRDLAGARVRYGYRRLGIMLRREGWKVNHKRVYRLYCQENLAVRTKRPRRRVTAKPREGRVPAGRINDCWSMDFMSDQLSDGRNLRVLTRVDNFTRESLAIEVGVGFTGHAVAAVLGRIAADRGRFPKSIRVDNGSGGLALRRRSSQAGRWTSGRT